MRNKAWLFVVMAVLLPMASAWALEGVEAIEDVWADSISSGGILPALGDMVSQPPLVPEGIRGGVRYADWSPARWSWVKAQAQDDPYTKRWVNTSMWGGNSSMYVMNKNYDYMYIPPNHKYYMSGFCWSPPDSVVWSPQPVTEPGNPKDRQAATISGVYLTPYEYGSGANQRLAMEVNIWLTMGLAW